MSKRYQNIMVAVDGSRQSIKAFAEALDLAKDNEAHLFIVSIINKVELTHSAYAFSKSMQMKTKNRSSHAEKSMMPKSTALLRSTQ